MAFYQSSGMACISLPNGASSLPNGLINMLKRCPQIYLWMDFDELGQLNIEVFANKLGILKTYLVKEKNVSDIIRYIQDQPDPLKFIGRKWLNRLNMESRDFMEVSNVKTNSIKNSNINNKDQKLIKEPESMKLTNEEKTIIESFDEEEDNNVLFKNHPEETEENDSVDVNDHFLNEIFCVRMNKLCSDSTCLENILCSTNADDIYELDNSDEYHMEKLEEYINENKIKDANDALLISKNLVRFYIEGAESIPQNSIITFHDIRDMVKDRILNLKKFEGVKASKEMNWFNKYLKGFRRGEFTLLTGHTGSGKTTFLNQYSLEFANQGIPTLFCSFELKNEVVLANMLKQYSGENLDVLPDKFDYWAERFQELPMYFQKFFGMTTMNKVMETITFTVDLYDVTHVILDNLQFMMGTQGKGFEKFDIQDELISRLRALATEKNIHITLVIHPRKSIESEDLSIASIFGTAKAIQEADNIFIIQNRDKFKIIDIKKNRFDGEVGRIPVVFNKDNKRFLAISLFELEALLSGKTIQEILNMKNNQLLELDQEVTQDLEMSRRLSHLDNDYKGGGNLNSPYVRENKVYGKNNNTQGEIGSFDSNNLLKNKNSSILNHPHEFNTPKRKIQDYKIQVKNNKTDFPNLNQIMDMNIQNNDKLTSQMSNEPKKVAHLHSSSRHNESLDILKHMKEEESREPKNKIGKFWIDNNNQPNFYENGRSNLDYNQVMRGVQDKSAVKNNSKNMSYEEQLEYYLSTMK